MSLRLVVAAALVGALAPSVARADTVVVYAYNFDFSINPPGQPIVDAVINPGDTVRWVMWQTSPIFHTTTAVLASPEQWASPRLFNQGQFYEHTFNTPGVFWYFCEPHATDNTIRNPNANPPATGMVGTVTVLPAPGAVAFGAGAMLLGARRRRA